MESSRVLVLFCVFIVFGVPTTVKAAEDDGWVWGYLESNGPDKWGDYYAKCNGDSQSPIDIVTADLTVDADLGTFTFKGYDSADDITSSHILNNGHTVQVSLTGDITVSEGDLPAICDLMQFHLHWGANGSALGSEHTLDGKQYPAEMHLVHGNSNYDAGEHTTKSDGLAVLGVFIEIGEENDALKPVIDALDDIEYVGHAVKAITLGALEDLLPGDTSVFYRYQGSLTSVTCDEAVVWTVFKDTISISQEQYDKLVTIPKITKENDATHTTLKDNFRPPQPLGDRNVYINQAVDEGSSEITTPGQGNAEPTTADIDRDQTEDLAPGLFSSFVVLATGLLFSLVF